MSRGKTENLFFKSEYELLKDRWHRTQDRETLAQLVQLSPPFGDQEVGKAIQAVLLDKRPDKKAGRDALWRDIDRVYRFVHEEQGETQAATYELIHKMFFTGSDDDDDRFDIKTIEKQHRRWASKGNR